MQFCQSNNQVSDLSKSLAGKVQLSLDVNAHFIYETVCFEKIIFDLP